MWQPLQQWYLQVCDLPISFLSRVPDLIRSIRFYGCSFPRFPPPLHQFDRSSLVKPLTQLAHTLNIARDRCALI
jgi:hypothetical protein